jgi:DNA primase
VLAVGHFQANEIIALVGTALQPEWLSGVQKVLLALDDDQGGREASKRIEQQLRWHQVSVGVCSTPSEDGKDWSERWRRHGSSGLDGLYAYQALLAHNL